MTNIKFGWKNLVLYFAALCLGVGALMAQPQHQQGPPPPPPRDPLAGLKHALMEAGAPALGAQQEQQLAQLIETARENRPKGPNDLKETMEAARRAYDNAVIAGNLPAANAQAAIIVQQISADANTHLQAEAKFKIDALNVLKGNANQITALTQRFGTAGLSHLLNSLAGGPAGGPPPPPNGERGPGGRP
ncbi:MAG: hypothetical protein ABI977_05340 [Acidobacteriota bacterium]